MRNYYKLNFRLNLPAESVINARKDRIHDLTACIYMFYKNIYILWKHILICNSNEVVLNVIMQKFSYFQLS